MYDLVIGISIWFAYAIIVFRLTLPSPKERTLAEAIYQAQVTHINWYLQK
jgi:hypothetical protein